MVKDLDFKNTLVRALEKRANNEVFIDSDLWRIISLFPQCNLFIEYTGIFSHREWNTYSAILNIQVPIEHQDTFNRVKHKILNVADQIFGRQNDYFLTDINIGILIERYEVIDFSVISITEVITKAIEDAELFMLEGKYDSALDRVHTAFHGYMRKILDNKGVSFEESETLGQLYNKIHNHISDNISSSDISCLVKTMLRSASGVVSSMNDLRNRHSLAHPNENLISEREAKLAIQIIRDIVAYLNELV